jgi:hypothetical protein
MARIAAPRSLWLTIALNAALLAVGALDGWAAVFWAEVGGSLGIGVTAAAGAVIFVLAALILIDIRRQSLLDSEVDDSQ